MVLVTHTGSFQFNNAMVVAPYISLSQAACKTIFDLDFLNTVQIVLPILRSYRVTVELARFLQQLVSAVVLLSHIVLNLFVLISYDLLWFSLFFSFLSNQIFNLCFKTIYWRLWHASLKCLWHTISFILFSVIFLIKLLHFRFADTLIETSCENTALVPTDEDRIIFLFSVDRRVLRLLSCVQRYWLKIKS